MAPIKVQLYHANWCGHCKSFMPEWEKFVEEAEKNGVTCESFEADKDKQEVEQANISGFPTIVIITNGTKEDYNGPRTAQAIMSHIKGEKTSAPAAGGKLNQCGGSRTRQRKSLNPNHEKYYKIKYFKYKAKYMKTKMD